MRELKGKTLKRNEQSCSSSQIFCQMSIQMPSSSSFSLFHRSVANFSFNCPPPLIPFFSSFIPYFYRHATVVLPYLSALDRMCPRQFNQWLFPSLYSQKSSPRGTLSLFCFSSSFIHITTVHPPNPFQAKSSPPYPSSSLFCATWFCLLSFHRIPT